MSVMKGTFPQYAHLPDQAKNAEHLWRAIDDYLGRAIHELKLQEHLSPGETLNKFLPALTHYTLYTLSFAPLNIKLKHKLLHDIIRDSMHYLRDDLTRDQ